MKQISDIDQGVVRRVDWQELVPPTLLLRAFSLTFKPSFLVLTAITFAVVGSTTGFKPNGTCELSAFSSFLDALHIRSCDVSSVASPSKPWGVAALLALFVLAWLALGISRTSVVKLSTISRSSTLSSLAFAFKKFKSALLPALLPVAIGFAGYVSTTLAHKFGAFGEACAPIFFVCQLILAALGAISVLALPFAISAIAAENSDCFDAIARGISYVTQRLLETSICWILGVIFTAIGAVFVAGAAHMCRYSFLLAYGSEPSNWIGFWNLTIESLPAAYCFVSFVVYTNAIYLMVRRSVDGTSFDSCALDLKPRKARSLGEVLACGKSSSTSSEGKDGEANQASTSDAQEPQV